LAEIGEGESALGAGKGQRLRGNFLYPFPFTLDPPSETLYFIEMLTRCKL
jgi:hypothetical protein